MKLKQGLRRRRGIGGTGSYGSSGSPSSYYISDLILSEVTQEHVFDFD